MTKLLIDADYIVYKSCASAEFDIDFGDDVIVVGSSFKEAYGNAVRELNKIREFFDSSLILFFSDSTNFHKSVDPSIKVTEIVKANGTSHQRKPEKNTSIRMPTLQADDAIGIYLPMMTTLWCHLIRI